MIEGSEVCCDQGVTEVSEMSEVSHDRGVAELSEVCCDRGVAEVSEVCRADILSATHPEHYTPRARHTPSTTHPEHDTPLARYTCAMTRICHDTPVSHTCATTHVELHVVVEKRKQWHRARHTRSRQHSRCVR